MLSRVKKILKEVDLEMLAKSQEENTELQEFLKERKTRIKLEKLLIPGSTKILICNTNSSIAQPFVTEPFRKQVFKNLHGLSHPGANSTAKRFV